MPAWSNCLTCGGWGVTVNGVYDDEQEICTSCGGSGSRVEFEPVDTPFTRFPLDESDEI